MPLYPPASSGSGAPSDATYITQTANGTLSAEQALASLSSGLMTVTTTTGVVSSVAAPTGAVVGTSDAQALSNKDLTSGTNTFPTLNQNTTGSAATLTTPRGIYGNNFDGSAALTQVIASTYGGTGNGFAKFSGPATSEKTFTLPNATSTILTDNAAVTVAQGGTGATTLTGILKGNGTSAVTAVTAPSGTIVGTSDSQILTNKDLSSSTNTMPYTNVYTSGSSASGTAGTTVADLQAGASKKLIAWQVVATQTNTASSGLTVTITYSDASTTTDSTAASSASQIIGNAGGLLRMAGGAYINLVAGSAKDVTRIKVTTAGIGTGTRAAVISALESS